VTLAESGGDLKSPGGSLTLLCRASGFDLSSFDTYWVRQGPGKELHWVAWSRNDNGSAIYAPWAGGRFTISRDNALSSVTLQMRNLTEEDSGIYFCAK
ncbi:HV03 protein, partial [Pitta sordida]|nr:HV03 protein [Pitta sordida]